MKVLKEAGSNSTLISNLCIAGVSAELTLRGWLHGLSQADAGWGLGWRAGLCAAFRLQLWGAVLTPVLNNAKWTLRLWGVMGFRSHGSGWHLGFCSSFTGRTGRHTEELPAFTLPSQTHHKQICSSYCKVYRKKLTQWVKTQDQQMWEGNVTRAKK